MEPPGGKEDGIPKEVDGTQDEPKPETENAHSADGEHQPSEQGTEFSWNF